MKEVFDVIPELEELINFGKFKSVVPVALEEGLLNITFSVLLEGENYQIIKKSGEIHNPLDLTTRGNWMRTETLVYSIERIGETIFIDEDPDKQKLLKNNLRIYLREMNEEVIKFLYSIYEELQQVSRVYVTEKLEESKKKFQETLKNLKPLSKLTSE